MGMSMGDPRVRIALDRIHRDGILRPSDEILAAVDDPHWDRPVLAHDWRRHVPPTMRDAWNTLPLETRLSVYESAEFSAMDEDAGSAVVSGPGPGER
jgi:hypothetical protein